MMKTFLSVVLLVAAFAHCVRQAAGHGTPINAYVQAESGQLAVFDGYEPGELEPSSGVEVFTDAPGIGVSSPVNGIAPGSALHLNVLQELMFWDGDGIAATNETLLIDWPDDGGTSPVEYYEVTAESGYQSGMLWGTYQPPGGIGIWDAHGDYAIDSASPTPGIYGVVFQLASPSYVASEPFLVPLVYDPAGAFAAADIASGVSTLRSAILPLPTADFDRNTSVDSNDLNVWETHYSMENAFQVQGDTGRDRRVAGEDFLVWQRQYSSAVNVFVTIVPEPGSGSLLVLTLVGFGGYLRMRGRKYSPN